MFVFFSLFDRAPKKKHPLLTTQQQQSAPAIQGTRLSVARRRIRAPRPDSRWRSRYSDPRSLGVSPPAAAGRPLSSRRRNTGGAGDSSAITTTGCCCCNARSPSPLRWMLLLHRIPWCSTESSNKTAAAELPLTDQVRSNPRGIVLALTTYQGVWMDSVAAPWPEVDRCRWEQVWSSMGRRGAVWWSSRSDDVGFARCWPGRPPATRSDEGCAEMTASLHHVRSFFSFASAYGRLTL